MSVRFRIASAIAAVTAAAALAGVVPAASAQPAAQMTARSASTAPVPSAVEMKSGRAPTPALPGALSAGGDSRQASTKTECTYEGNGWYDCTEFECSSNSGVTVCTSTEMYYKKAGNPTHFPHN